MATLKDIAGKTGFSVAVVSRALNPRADERARVAPATLKLIVRVAREMGFRRNRMAEFMRRGSSPTVGVFLPEYANRLVADLIFGISEVLSAEDLPIQIEFDAYLESFRKFIRSTVDLAHSGVISYAALTADPELEKEVAAYRSKGGKVVLLNTLIRPEGVPVIVVDNYEGGRQAAKRLLARKCVRFAVVGTFPCRDRGFREHLSANGRTATEFGYEDSDFKALAKYCRKASASGPVGIFAISDKWALRVMRALSGTSLRIGRDIMLIGFDDQELTADITPALTTLRQPFREEGGLAARKLVRMINGNDETSATLQPYLVIRETA